MMQGLYWIILSFNKNDKDMINKVSAAYEGFDMCWSMLRRSVTSVAKTFRNRP